MMAKSLYLIAEQLAVCVWYPNSDIERIKDVGALLTKERMSTGTYRPILRYRDLSVVPQKKAVLMSAASSPA